MATVRRPSSLAARKIRMAISLRLAARSLRMDRVVFIREAAEACAKFYIVSWTERETGTDFPVQRTQIICVRSREVTRLDVAARGRSGIGAGSFGHPGRNGGRRRL